MEIGPLIKLHRIKQNMTQEDLAAGIVSESYLSKIENQKTDASSEVIQLLCERLGIQLNADNEELIEEKTKEWYGLLYDAQNPEERRKKYEELESLFKASNSDHEMLFEIFKIRYFLLEKENKYAKAQIEKLEHLEYSFEPLQAYYWNKFLGNYSQIVDDHEYQALQYYKKAEELSEKADLPDTEVADMHYTLSVINSRLINDLNSLEYARKALDVFRHHYNFVRCAQCHILLGICYRRMHMVEMAIKQYSLAQHLGEITDNASVIQLTNHNLGYLHSTLGESKKAIHYLEQAYNMGDELTDAQISTAINLVGEYYNIKDFESAKRILDENYKKIKDLRRDVNKAFKMELDVYYFAVEEKYEHFEHLIANELLPYLIERNDHGNVVTYANMIGEHFEKIKKYKNAANYYKLASSHYQKLLRV